MDLRWAKIHARFRSARHDAADDLPAKSTLGFLSLPPEIRVQIYELLLVSPHEVQIPFRDDGEHFKTDWFTRYWICSGIISRSKTIYNEVAPIIYGKNKVMLGLTEDDFDN